MLSLPLAAFVISILLVSGAVTINYLFPRSKS